MPSGGYEESLFNTSWSLTVTERLHGSDRLTFPTVVLGHRFPGVFVIVGHQLCLWAYMSTQGHIHSLHFTSRDESTSTRITVTILPTYLQVAELIDEEPNTDLEELVEQAMMVAAELRQSPDCGMLQDVNLCKYAKTDFEIYQPWLAGRLLKKTRGS